MSAARFDVVVPTIGRPSLDALLTALAAQTPPLPRRILLVDDRRLRPEPLLTSEVPAALAERIVVVTGEGRGPAAARNLGWRASDAAWIAFLDDDVVPTGEWTSELAAEISGARPEVAGIQGRVRVPLPAQRAPTDQERHVAGLQTARFATADLTYRRAALVAARGFDARFPRAYREDADLALRLRRAGWEIVSGRREVVHPVRSAGALASLRRQAGNGDDVLMRVLHGRDWRRDACAPKGRSRRHLAVASAGLAAPMLAFRGYRKPAGAAALGYLLGAGELARARIKPGPRTAREVATMLATSAPMPLVAAGYRLAGWGRAARMSDRAPLATDPPPPATDPPPPPATDPPPPPASERGARPAPQAPEAVLLDRDGTLIEDVPYNGDPERVRPLPGTLEALERLRAAGVRLAVVSNQSGIGRGILTPPQVHAVNRRVEELLGPLGPWFVCAHAPEAQCACRKPRPGLVLSALRRLAVAPERCAMIGDIGADVQAASAAGVRPILVPTERTLAVEISDAPEVAGDLPGAVELLMGAAC